MWVATWGLTLETCIHLCVMRLNLLIQSFFHCCAVFMLSWSVVTRQRSWSFAEYCKHFVAHLNDVRAFGYNSAGSERIWMKFGELLSILSGAGPDRFWARSAQRRERERKPIFSQVNNARLYRFLVRQISRNLHTRRGSATWWILS